jgi:teichuronic acid biosynthesis glycosyltransferase TuaC
MQILMITSEWPTPEHPEWVPFLVQQTEYLRKAGIGVDVFSFRGAKNPVNYVKGWLKVHKKLRTENYDLIHAQYGQSGLIAFWRRIPLVVTFHGSDLQGDVSHGKYTYSGQLLKLASKLVACNADAIVVVSSVLAQLLNRKSQIHIIPCGLDLELFQPMDQSEARARLNLPREKKYILFGGRPEMPVKRYELAKSAVKLLPDNEIEMLTVSAVPHHQMPVYLNACNVLLLTSLHEGSPTIVKEALACNLPIVSTNVGDVRERIGTVDGCIVCTNDQPETIAIALADVLKTNCRTTSRHTVFDLDENILTRKLISVYRSALGKD